MPSLLYVEVIVSVLAPVPPAVYVEEQLAVVELTVASVHGVVPKVPGPLLAKVTVPVGVVAPLPEVSLTVAVQVAALLIAIEAGEHVSVVVVWRAPPITSAKVPKLVECTESPL